MTERLRILAIFVLINLVSACTSPATTPIISTSTPLPSPTKEPALEDTPTATASQTATATPDPPDLAKFGDIYKVCPASSAAKLDAGLTFGVLSDVANECYGEVSPEVNKEEGLLSHLKIIYKVFDGTTMPDRDAVIEQEVKIFINPSPENLDLLENMFAPTPTPTPIPWRSFIITETVSIHDVGRLWMPLPTNWNGIGMANVKILEIKPEPQEIYADIHGNRIAYWYVGGRKGNYKIVFSLDLSIISVDINPETIEEIDKSSEEFALYTNPSEWIQSDDEQIINLAKRIIVSENNPYKQARLIHKWVAKNIRGGDTGDALTTLERKSAGCGGKSHIFVALLRAIGIPARNVFGIHGGSHTDLQSGRRREDAFSNHIWSEFFLPEYGWIQVDAGDQNGFGMISDYRIVLGKGEDIELGNGYPLGTVPWFHSPNTNNIGGSTPGTQTWGKFWAIEIKEIK